MYISKHSLAIGMLVLGLAAGDCWGGPPTTSSGSQWYNPMQWQMPSLPWGGEPPRIRKKSQGLMADMNQSAKRGWAKTKSVLDPSQLFVSDPKPASSKSAPGFWEGLFGPSEEKREVRTVNDFLSQPHPR